MGFVIIDDEVWFFSGLTRKGESLFSRLPDEAVVFPDEGDAQHMSRLTGGVVVQVTKGGSDAGG